MAGAFAIVCVLEWLAARETVRRSREPAATAPVHPVVEAQRVEDTDEHDALGWTAFEEAQEPSDAMTIIGAPLREEEEEPAPEPTDAPALVADDIEPVDEAEAEPEPEPQPEPEPELPPAAEADVERGRTAAAAGGAAATQSDEAGPEPDPPRARRVLPAEEAGARTRGSKDSTAGRRRSGRRATSPTKLRRTRSSWTSPSAGASGAAKALESGLSCR